MPPASRVFAFLMVFTALFIFSLAVTVTAEFADSKWVLTVVRIGEGLGRLTFVSIAIAFILVEGIPMLAAWYKKQMEVKAREEGLAEGLAEGRTQGLAEGLTRGRAEERGAWLDWHNKLQAWEQRKADTEGEGRVFTEPRPSPPSDD